MMKKIMLLCCLLLSMMLVACGSSEDEVDSGQAPAPEDTTIRLAKATWDTGWFQAAVFEHMLEDLGYEVDDIGTIDNTAFYISVAEGKDVDLWVNGWFPIHDDYLADEKVAGKAEAIGYQVEGGALQGYLVDKKSAEAYGITSIEDLKDPEIAAIFDSDDNGKADLIGCDAGWGCETVIFDSLTELGLDDTVEQRQGTYSALMADTIGRYTRGEPILFYTWTPNWTVSQLKLDEDVVWIESPIASTEPAEGILGCAVDPCNMGFAASDIRVVANSEFLNTFPDIKLLLESVKIPLNDIAEQNQKMVDGEDSDEDIAAQATSWIEDNQTQIDEWVDAAKALQ